MRLLNQRSQQGFAATAGSVQEVQFGHLYQRACAEWEKAAKGPAVSILGWTEPWLTSSESGESPAFPGGPWKCCTFVILGFSGVSSSLCTATVPEKQEGPDVVTDPVKSSMWPPQAGRAAPGLNTHRCKARAVTTPHPLTHPFPISRSPEKSALYLTACHMLCCSAVLTPLLLEGADQFSKVIQVVDRSPLMLLTEAQTQSPSA